MPMPSWPSDDEDKMREWWDKEFSCQQISDAFQGKYSRKAISGKARRLNLTSRPSTMNRGREHRRPIVVKPITPPKPTPVPVLVAPIAIGPVDDFPTNGCKWIAGDPSVTWQCCGHPIDRQSLYSFHANIAFTKPLPAKPATQVNLNARAARVIR